MLYRNLTVQVDPIERKFYLEGNVNCKTALVLYSSGLESITNVYLLLRLNIKPYLLHFTYNHLAAEIELIKTRELAKKLNLPLYIIEMPELAPISNFDEEEAESSSHYIPVRNTLFITYALKIAEENQLDAVVLGANLSESMTYPDNSYPYIFGFGYVANYATQFPNTVTILTPLINLTKTYLVKLGELLNVDYSMSNSCYYPNENGEPCNKCGSCILRNIAFERAEELGRFTLTF